MTQITQADIGNALASSVLLVAFESWSWTGEATDANAVQDVKTAQSATGDVGKFRKNLLANNAGPLSAVRKAIAAAYREHTTLTAPWGNQGYRMLPNGQFEKYLGAMAKHRVGIKDAVDKLVEAYPDAMEKAIASLGGLADRGQYPDAASLPARFGIKFDFLPVPTTGFGGMPDNFASALNVELQKQNMARAKVAIDDLWTQIKTLLDRYHKQTRPDGKIFDSTVEEVLDLPARVRTFNVFGDAALEAVAQRLASEVTVYNRAALDDDKVRAWCHAKSGEIAALVP